MTPALQLETSKQKRSRFSDKHGTEGSRLADLLREKRKEFPSYRGALDELINKVVQRSGRTRKSDREEVLSALREWEFGLTTREIAEDTGLSLWDVRQIVSQLVATGVVVEKRELRPGGYNPVKRANTKQWHVSYRLASLKSQANRIRS